MATIEIAASTTWSGHISSQDADSWAAARAGTGDSIAAWIGSSRGSVVSSWFTVNNYFAINRDFLSFDTSPLSGLILETAELQITCWGPTFNDSGENYANTYIYVGTQQCPLVSGDWNAFGAFIDSIIYDEIGPGANSIPLNVNLINTEGTTKFALKISSDVNNLDIGGGGESPDITNQLRWYVGGAKLVVTYTPIELRYFAWII